MPLNTTNPEPVAPINNIQPEINNIQPLPEVLYCPHCNANLVESGMEYTENISGNRWGTASIDMFSRIDFEFNDEEITDSDEQILTCSVCDREMDSYLFSKLEFLEKINNLKNNLEYQIPFNSEIRKPRTWDTTYIEGKSICHFHNEILPIINELITQSPDNIPEFNRNHEVYRQQTETQRTQEQSDQDGPEHHESITASHHQRWNQGVNYPSNTADCPNCSHLFIVDNSEEEHICPKCQHDWDPTNINLENTGIEIRNL